MDQQIAALQQQAGAAVEAAMVVITTYGLSVLGALFILVIGWIAAGRLGRLVVRVTGRAGRIDPTLQSFFASLVRYGVLAFTIIAVLNQFGVQTASLIAVLGAAGLAIGLALQGTLAHVAAGVMLLIFRPFRLGDDIEAAGLSGRVRSMSLFTTELITPDNVQILIPNGQLWDKPIKNMTTYRPAIDTQKRSPETKA